VSASITRHNLELASEAFKSERIASLERQLSDAKAALRASTELLRETHNDIKKSWRLGWAGICIRLRTQIAANERVLGGGK